MKQHLVFFSCLFLGNLSFGQPQNGNPLDDLPKLPNIEKSKIKKTIEEPKPLNLLDRRLVIKKINIQGVKSIDFEKVSVLVQNIINTEKSVNDLVEISKKITQLYNENGYILSFSYIPNQTFENGIVNINVVEGYIDKIDLSGDYAKSHDKIQAILSSLLDKKPLDKESFDRTMAILRQLPGFTFEANANLPQTNDGKSILKIKSSHKKFDFSSGLDTQASNPRLIVNATANDLIIGASQLQLTLLAIPEENEKFNSVGYSQLIGEKGLVMSFSLSSYSNKTQNITDQNVYREQHTDRAQLSFSYTLKASDRENLNVSGGAYIVSSKDENYNTSNNVFLNYDNKVSAVYAQLNYAVLNGNTLRRANFQITQGIKSASSSDINTNLPLNLSSDIDLDFTKLTFNGSQTNNWPYAIETIASLSSQYSSNILPSSERISFGGSNYGRAYLAGQIAGDSGFGISLEINQSYSINYAYLKQIKPYFLLDYSHTYNNSDYKVLSSLSSLSLGAKLSDKKQYSLDLSVAKPLKYKTAFDNASTKVNLFYTYKWLRD